MKEKSLTAALGCIDDDLVSDAIYYEPIRLNWLKYAAVAAGAVLVIFASIGFAVSHIGTHAVDPWQIGVCHEISDMDELSALCGEELLVNNLDLSKFDVWENALYCDEETGEPRDHILYADPKGDPKETGITDISICTWFIGDLESHRTRAIFTAKKTEVYDISGVKVYVAPHPFEFNLTDHFDRYAVFEYNDKVYYIEVRSYKADKILEIVESMLGGI